MTQQLRPPRGINFLNAIARPLLAAGLPMGFNGLVTIRGRKSGQPRTTPVAIIESGGRRWVWAPWGEVNWVQNLRAAGRATIEVRRQTEDVTATELDPAQRLEFFRDVLRRSRSACRAACGSSGPSTASTSTDPRRPPRTARSSSCTRRADARAGRWHRDE